MQEITFELATPEDDAELRRLLRENPFPGRMLVSLEREPNYFTGAMVEGPFHQTIITRDQSRGEIIGMGSRSIRDMCVNGTVRSVGYLGQLRVARRYRRDRKAFMRGLTQGYEFLRTLHQDGRAPFYYSTVIEDNLPARRLFSAGLPGLPRYQEHARLHTLAIHCRRKRESLALPDGLQLIRGSPSRIDAIVACLQRNGARYQLTPHWTGEMLLNPRHTPNLAPKDFFLAMDGDSVVGCLAVWDQSSFKQTVVRGYSRRMARWRRLINIGARIVGRPTLPPPNTPIRHCYASHLAVDDDNPEAFAVLLRSAYNHAVDQGHEYLMLGLCEDHPFLESVMSTYPHIDYRSLLYLIAWEEELEVLSEVDGRLPGVEVSVL
jgi:hypothetical protein